jgi:hypothetical protein
MKTLQESSTLDNSAKLTDPVVEVLDNKQEPPQSLESSSRALKFDISEQSIKKMREKYRPDKSTIIELDESITENNNNH